MFSTISYSHQYIESEPEYLPSLKPLTRSAGTVNGSQWLTGFTHRKSHIINQTSGVGVGYQIGIKTYWRGGIDGNEVDICVEELHSNDWLVFPWETK